MKRKLSFFFKPKSVACIGASETKGKVGFAVMSNIVDSFKGDIYPINKKRDTIFGFKAFKSVLDIEASIDIAIICIPASFVIDTVKECAQKGIKGLVIISAGFKEVGGEGTIFEEKIQKIALENDIRIIGPNCLGIISPFLNASFATKTPKKGKIAMISQSGAMMTAILDWAEKEGIGFSNFVSIGNKTDLDEVDFIEDFAEDPETNTIILYIESVNNGMKFLQNVPKVARKKPIIILKSGISEAGSRAASSHTGALAGNDISFDIAFEKCGVIRAKTMTDLFDYAKCFNKVSLIPKGKQFAIITNAGGPGIITTDAFDTFNVGLSRFSSETIKELRKNLPKEASIYDPVDIIGDATPDRYKTALEIIFKEPETICAGALVLVTPQAQTEPNSVADILIEVQEKFPNKLIIAVFMGGITMNEATKTLQNSRIPVFDFPEQAIKSLKCLTVYSDLQKKPDINTRKIPRFRISPDRIEEIFQNVRKDNRTVLMSSETSEIFRLYGIINPKTMLAKSVQEAENFALKIGFPVVMKIVSPEIIHKTDIGGVLLNIKNEHQARDGFIRIINNSKQFGPKNARIYGVEVQEMINQTQHKKSTQLIIGMSRDPQWGPLLMIGSGGIYANFLQDVAFDLSYKYLKDDARNQLAKTKINNILMGVRGEPRSDIDAVLDVLIRLSQLVQDFPDIVELDINPLLVFEESPEHDSYSAVDIKITITKKVENISRVNE